MVLKSGLMYGGSPGLHWSSAPAILPAGSVAEAAPLTGKGPVSPLSKHAAVPVISCPIGGTRLISAGPERSAP